MFLQRCMINCWCLNTMKYDVIDDVYYDKWIDVACVLEFWWDFMMRPWCQRLFLDVDKFHCEILSNLLVKFWRINIYLIHLWFLWNVTFRLRWTTLILLRNLYVGKTGCYSNARFDYLIILMSFRLYLYDWSDL
jgi:hypothetical protein